MKYQIIYWLIIIIIFIGQLPCLGQSAEVDTIALEFSAVDSGPYCFSPHKQIKRPRIGIALSGGGARGFAQIGVLEVLEQNHIPIDCIVGSSMGSIIGGLYAAGYSPQEIYQLAKKIDWLTLMEDTPPRTNLFIGQKQERGRAILQIRFKGTKPAFPQALSPGQKLSIVLTNLTLLADYPTTSDFDRLRVPFRALSCDLISGQKVLLRRGNLAEAMRASSAVPLLFMPVVMDSMLLVDGGLINNIPVDEVNNFPVDLIIGVDTVSKLRDRNNLNAPWEIADQVTSIMQREKNAQQREKASILIKIDMDDFKFDSFQFIDEMIAAGRTETKKYVEQIKKQIDSFSKLHCMDSTLYNLAGIGVKTDDQFSTSMVKMFTDSLVNQRISYKKLYSILQEIYETGYFDDVNCYVTKNEGSIFASFKIQSKPILKKIIIEGNTVFSDSVLIKNFSSEFGKPINYHRSKQDILQLIRYYKQAGYALMTIKSAELIDGILHLTIDEGKLSAIVIEGNERTKDYVILREFPLKPGDIFNIRDANEGLNNIHSTGLFENVTFEVFPQQSNVQLKIKVKEKAFTLFRLSYRYDLERNSKSMLEIADENWLGTGNQISFQTQYGAKDQILKLKFRDDRIFRTYMTYHLDIFFNRQKYYSYNNGLRIGEYQQQESGISFLIGQQIKRLGLFSIVATLNTIDLKRVSGSGYPQGKTEFKTITIQSIVDSQDQMPFPRSGKLYQFFYKMSSARFLVSQASFIKLFTSYETYYTFYKRNTIHPRLFWGTSDLTTPFVEQFRIGGLSSFYGMRENEKIGRHVIGASLEYRYFFPFGLPINFYWSIRYDIGSVWKNKLDLENKKLDQGMGTALEIETPAGPISLAIGKKIGGNYVLYFSAGFKF